jgi:hypothetical protein
MFKGVLISIVIIPVVLGMRAASSRRVPRGVVVLLALLLAYDVMYLALLYYLRVRWLG